MNEAQKLYISLNERADHVGRGESANVGQRIGHAEQCASERRRNFQKAHLPVQKKTHTQKRCISRAIESLGNVNKMNT